MIIGNIYFEPTARVDISYEILQEFIMKQDVFQGILSETYSEMLFRKLSVD